MLNADLDKHTRAIDRRNAELAFRAVAEPTADEAGLEFLRQPLPMTHGVARPAPEHASQAQARPAPTEA